MNHKLITNNSTRRGFTLIELLVVISIIGILSAIGMTSYNNTQGKARDAQRKTILKDMQKALQQYYQDNGQYPTTSNAWCSSETGDTGFTGCGGAGGNYIPNLAPTYVPTLPRDPKGGTGMTSAPCSGNFKRAFVYKSDGLNYKLMNNCAPEGNLNSSDPITDPCRTTSAWAVGTKDTMTPTGCAAGW